MNSQLIKKMNPIFELQTFQNSQYKSEYIRDLIEVILHKKKINNPILCMNELNDIISQLKIPLKNQQMHQLYLYSTYQRFNKIQQTKKKLLAMVNQQKNKVDTKSAADWLSQKIDSGEIKIIQPRQQKAKSEYIRSKTSKKIDKLPSLRGTYGQKLQQQLKYLIQIFEQMQRQRQHSGLIPLNENEQDDVQIPISNIPYDPQLYTLNNNLSKLRIRAEDRLARIIELAKSDNRIRVKLEQAIQKFQRQRIEINEKVGRMGAMKAYKRVIQRKKEEIKKIKNLKLGEQENLVRATHLHGLLNLPVITTSKLVH